MTNFKNKILNNKYLSFLQIATNWFMQGILHADKSERIYKLLFTSIFFSLFCFIADDVISFSHAINLFIISHSLNFFINCNLSVLLIHRIKWLKTSKVKLFKYLFIIQERFKCISNKDWILYCVSHGGICKGTLNHHSDIDVCIIRKPGLINLIKSIVFYVREKKIADYYGIPLDIFICDSPLNCRVRSKFQDNPIVICDHLNLIDEFYPKKNKITIAEAMIINNCI